MAKLTALLNIFGLAPAHHPPHAHSAPAAQCHAFPRLIHTQNINETLTAYADEVVVLRRRLSAQNVAYLNILVMGEIAPPAILHSTDINRSSQDTQQLRASQTEPVRHGAGGWEHNKAQFFTTGAQELLCQKT